MHFTSVAEVKGEGKKLTEWSGKIEILQLLPCSSLTSSDHPPQTEDLLFVSTILPSRLSKYH